MLAECVWAISRSKGTFLSSQYHRFARRLGKTKAIVASSHRLLIVIYHVLRDGQPYRDLGSDYYETRDKEHLRTSALRRLESLGYIVTLTEQNKEEVSV